ncbi:protein SCAI [Neltuma alba]|uniref:protein SCAI n=1 Tax=Neltuma alba TaxID=207710 RepID=UPI0010A5132D|nr:protein SCAI-like [Prosopis alba]
MSHQQSTATSSNIPVSEVFWTLVDKADKKFSKIRDLPYYQRTRYDTYFYKVFKVYTQLWKFQQENRQKLVESGLKRWEIGEIASRIGQLYFGQYMRTSDGTYLSESYIFYEAILTREYFKEGLFQDVNIANKQLRFLARFLTVCLVSNRREMVQQLVNQIKLLADECRRAFQESDFKEWKLVVQEAIRFLKADTTFMNIRPLRYSLVLDPHPDTLPHVAPSITKRNLKLQDALLSSFHHNEVKFSELTIDTFRMLQCLEWEPSGSFYQSNSKLSQNGASGSSRIGFSQDIVDPTLPANPRKAVLYRPSLTNYMAVLATICEELPSDGILLIYLSASGYYAFYCSAGPIMDAEKAQQECVKQRWTVEGLLEDVMENEGAVRAEMKFGFGLDDEGQGGSHPIGAQHINSADEPLGAKRCHSLPDYYSSPKRTKLAPMGSECPTLCDWKRKIWALECDYNKA